MWRRILLTALVGVLAIVPIVIADYFFVRSGQDTSTIWFNPWLGAMLWALGPISLFLVNYHFSPAPGHNRYLAAVAWTIGLSVVWFLVAFQVHVGFHFGFGGRL